MLNTVKIDFWFWVVLPYQNYVAFFFCRFAVYLGIFNCFKIHTWHIYRVFNWLAFFLTSDTSIISSVGPFLCRRWRNLNLNKVFQRLEVFIKQCAKVLKFLRLRNSIKSSREHSPTTSPSSGCHRRLGETKT
jgi:hypothetical protein